MTVFLFILGGILAGVLGAICNLKGYKRGFNEGLNEYEKLHMPIKEPIKVATYPTQPVRVCSEQVVRFDEMLHYPEKFKIDIYRRAAEKIGIEMFKSRLLKVEERIQPQLNATVLRLEAAVYPPINADNARFNARACERSANDG